MLDPPVRQQFRRSVVPRRLPNLVDMITHKRLSSIFVLDQDKALDFYVGTLGLEVGADVDLGFMRWLTVRVPGEKQELLLERPGRPAHDDVTESQVRELVSKGAAGGWVAFGTDDVQGTFDDLKAKGVEITQEPMTQSYGTDFAIRDPFGNHIRIGDVD